MHRTDGDANVGGLFADPVPGVSPATQVGAVWLNAIQEEIAHFIATTAGIALVKADNTQLEQALRAVLLDKTTNQNVNSVKTFLVGLAAQAVSGVRPALFGGGVDDQPGLDSTAADHAAGIGARARIPAAVASLTALARRAFKAGAGPYTPDPTYLEVIDEVWGAIKLAANNPAKTRGYTSALTPLNVPKAWAYIYLNNTVAPAWDGFNITSIAQDAGTGKITVTIADDMGDANYAVIANLGNAGGIFGNGAPWVDVRGNNIVPKVAGAFDMFVRFYDPALGTTADQLPGATNGAVINLVVFGRQPNP